MAVSHWLEGPNRWQRSPAGLLEEETPGGFLPSQHVSDFVLAVAFLPDKWHAASGSYALDLQAHLQKLSSLAF